VLERIAFRMPRGILPQAGQRPQQISDAIEAIAHEMPKAAPDFVVGRQLMLGHPTPHDPPPCPQARSLRVDAPGHQPGRLGGDATTELVVMWNSFTHDHYSGTDAASVRQRRLRRLAAVA
jgi:hypothetical protein